MCINGGQFENVVALHASLEGSEAFTTIKENLVEVTELDSVKERIEAGMKLDGQDMTRTAEVSQDRSSYDTLTL